ncbi:uncharacterized protein FIBRA_08951 [Fibroporia radiculosa]|uniref:peptide-methionine (S)-S-oxide reductase n=1 Tax=Fibroporia radiculosa TaxID=599839 RepID=J4ICM4_9APHY|nr:uncharacterized protein FIBRA_08951 [Fibroporia radiculosa]CCM06666.1 predicted protein [Fibroporia radiculosa]
MSMLAAATRLRLSLSALLTGTPHPPVLQNTRPASALAMSGTPPIPLPSAAQPEVATFAAGCFWGVEHIFLKHYPIPQNKGILRTAVGYIGGRSDAVDPDYETVCSGRTGHAEALRIEFDPCILTYAQLVEFFYRTHDPTTVNSQGNDYGTQYRSAIFYHSPEQHETAARVTAEIQKSHFDPFGKKIVTDLVPAGPWFDAEDYHQEYLHKNPSGYQCPTHTLHW